MLLKSIYALCAISQFSCSLLPQLAVSNHAVPSPPPPPPPPPPPLLPPGGPWRPGQPGGHLEAGGQAGRRQREGARGGQAAGVTGGKGGQKGQVWEIAKLIGLKKKKKKKCVHLCKFLGCYQVIFCLWIKYDPWPQFLQRSILQQQQKTVKKNVGPFQKNVRGFLIN